MLQRIQRDGGKVQYAMKSRSYNMAANVVKEGIISVCYTANCYLKYIIMLRALLFLCSLIGGQFIMSYCYFSYDIYKTSALLMPTRSLNFTFNPPSPSFSVVYSHRFCSCFQESLCHFIVDDEWLQERNWCPASPWIVWPSRTSQRYVCTFA